MADVVVVKDEEPEPEPVVEPEPVLDAVPEIVDSVESAAAADVAAATASSVADAVSGAVVAAQAGNHDAEIMAALAGINARLDALDAREAEPEPIPEQTIEPVIENDTPPARTHWWFRSAHEWADRL